MTSKPLQSFKGNWKLLIVLVLLLLNLLLWVEVYQRTNGKYLTVHFLDVGQGDAILIESTNHGRILIDGGPDRKVLSRMSKFLPFWDKRIDVVIATHPDKDHIGGLPEVFNRYGVKTYIEPEVISDSSIDTELEKKVVEEKSQKIFAKRGLIIDLGDGAQLVFLYPNQDVSHSDTNDASIVAKLIFGESTFLFTGDAPLRTETILMSEKENLNSDVLKVAHHGSKTSSILPFLEEVSPEYAVISAGKNNSYGHPHKEVLSNLEKVGAKILSTAKQGTITFRTDGKRLSNK